MPEFQAYLFKTDSIGNLVKEDTFVNENERKYFFDIVAVNGGYVLTGSLASSSGANGKVFAVKIDDDLNQIWSNTYGSLVYRQQGISTSQSEDGKLVIVGDAVEVNDTVTRMVLIKTDSLGSLYTSALTGTIHHDPELDCLPNPAESGLANWLVQAEGAQSFATLTDSLGHFTLPVDTGSYEVTVAPPETYW